MIKKRQNEHLPSFRDPDSIIIKYKNKYYRNINKDYKNHYELLIKSGLYDSLIQKNLLVSHEEVIVPGIKKSYKTILPQQISCISYPFEWSFSQLKDAALTTLNIQKTALAYGMTLKDASAYNIQFNKGKPVFIDTTSFVRRNEGEPWIGYKQFCEHFLCPLLLMSKKNIHLHDLLKTNLDGIPITLTHNLLPKRTYLNFSIFMHIHLHALFQKKMQPAKLKKRNLPQKSLFALIANLEKMITSLHVKDDHSFYYDYDPQRSYTKEAINCKKEIVSTFLSQIGMGDTLDLGTGNGEFSFLSAENGNYTISIDNNINAIDTLYNRIKETNNNNILPLIIDITNPTASIGWDHTELLSFKDRNDYKTIIMTALLHHLVLHKNIPLTMISKFLADITRFLIIEFIPKEDKMAQMLLTNKRDTYSDYTEKSFEKIFKRNFKILKKIEISQSLRTLYLLENTNGK